MLKRGVLAVFAIVFSALLALIQLPQEATATWCLIDAQCKSDEHCINGGGWGGGSCLKITCSYPLVASPVAGYFGQCNDDGDCAPGGYCQITKYSAIVKHQCVDVDYGECKSCTLPLADCNANGGCETNLKGYDNNNCGSCGTVCPSGSCQLGECPPPDPCEDKDSDDYQVPKVGFSASLCKQPIDCVDSGSVNGIPASAIHPNANDVCGNGVDEDCSGGDSTCPCSGSPPPPSCLRDVCGDGKVTGSEQCEPGVSSGSKNCGDYGTISYGCKNDGSCTWETVACPRCGDGTVQLPEQCEPGVSSGTLVCDSGAISYGCKNDGSCTWESASCPEPLKCTAGEWSCTEWSNSADKCGTRTCTLTNLKPKDCSVPQIMYDSKPSESQDCTVKPTCTDKEKNGEETGIDCGGTCTKCPVVTGGCTGTAPSCSLTQGVCSGKSKTCDTGTGSWVDCSSYGSNYQGVESKCDGLDNDCDGITDEVGIGFQKAGAACEPGVPVVSDPCTGVDLDSSKTCCQSAGFVWAASGEENVDDRTFGGFSQYKQEGCVGDDAGEYIGYRQCRSGICTTDVADFAACNSNRDCVYSAKCYSDVKEIAAAKFGGDISQVWGSQYKARSYHNVNAEPKTLEVCDPGFWGGAGGEVGGKVTDVEGKAIANAQVKIIGTTFVTTTAADGSYSFSDVSSGAYDFVASKSGSQYGDTLKAGQDVAGFGTTTVDFVLTLPKGDCNDDCTKADGLCHSECQGKGQCSFYSEETRSVCDFAVPGIVDYAGKQVLCCTGNLYEPVKAQVSVDADNVITRRIPVLRQGKLVNLVILVFNQRA